MSLITLLEDIPDRNHEKNRITSLGYFIFGSIDPSAATSHSRSKTRREGNRGINPHLPPPDLYVSGINISERVLEKLKLCIAHAAGNNLRMRKAGCTFMSVSFVLVMYLLLCVWNMVMFAFTGL